MGKIGNNKNIEKTADIIQDNNDSKDADKLLNIRQLIKNICKDKNITAKKLCENICSESYFSEFINKGKLISKLMLDLFLQRLGLNEGNFEYYLSSKEYEILNIRYEIIDLIKRKEIKNAKKQIDKFRLTVGEMDKLHERFVLLMEARIMELEGEAYDKIYFTIKEAVKKTVPDFEDGSFSELLLGYDELFFIIDCTNYRDKIYNDDISQKIYNEIINYVEKSDFEDITKANLHAKTGCLIARRNFSNNENMVLLKNCNKAINYLKRSTKLYFIEEIMENKSIALNNIINSYESKEIKSENDLKFLNLYKNTYEANEKERRFFCELLKRYHLSTELYGWYPLNHNREIYSIGEIIKLRREMLNMSIANLSEITGISEKTISRIENRENNAYSHTIKNIFMALGILGESQAYVFDCSNYESYQLEKKLSRLIDLNKYEEAYEVLELFKRNINLLSKLNKQYLGHKETVILRRTKKIDNDDALNRFIKALELTLTEDIVFSNEKKYFTKREIMLIYNIALIYEENGKNKEAIKWLAWCEKYYDNFNLDISNYIITYELVMTLYSSLQGDIGNYDKSDEIAEKTMHESLKCRRGNFIGRLIYNEAFNLKKRIEDGKKEMQSHEIDLYKDKLEQALAISQFIDDKLIEKFLKNKLAEI